MTLTDRTRYDGSPTLAAALDELGASAGHWTIDPLASTFELRGRYVFGPAVTARFKVASGGVDIAGDRSGITGTLLLDAASVDSGIGLRDHHVRERRSALDVDRYPSIRFDLDGATPGRPPRSTSVGASPSATSPGPSSSGSTHASTATRPSSPPPATSSAGTSRSTSPASAAG